MTDQAPAPEQPILTPKQAQQYLAELVGEYMKTLPGPIRAPVTQCVNGCLQCLSVEIRVCAQLRETMTLNETEVERLQKKVERMEKKAKGK